MLYYGITIGISWNEKTDKLGILLGGATRTCSSGMAIFIFIFFFYFSQFFFFPFKYQTFNISYSVRGRLCLKNGVLGDQLVIDRE